MTEDLENILDNISEEFLNNDLVKEYIELNKLVYEKYAKEIVMFETAKEKLDEAKKYKENLKRYEENLIRTKEALYTIPEVKRIKELEGIISNSLLEMSNDISGFMSDTFKKKKGI